MMVVLARELAIALWRYLETGLIPEGAIIAALTNFLRCAGSGTSRGRAAEVPVDACGSVLVNSWFAHAGFFKVTASRREVPEPLPRAPCC